MHQTKDVRFHPWKDHFDTVVENLRFLNEYRKEKSLNFKIYLTGILTRFTEALKNDYYTVFSNLADQIVLNMCITKVDICQKLILFAL